MNNYETTRTKVYDLRYKNNVLPIIPQYHSHTPKLMQSQCRSMLAYSCIDDNTCSKAQNLLQTHLNKLNYKKHLLRSASCGTLPYNRDVYGAYPVVTKNKMNLNPYVHNQRYMNPIYFSINNSPSSLSLSSSTDRYPYRNVQLSNPFTLSCCRSGHNHHGCNCSCSCGHSHAANLPELITLFAALGKINSCPCHHQQYPVLQIPQIINCDNHRRRQTPIKITPIHTPKPIIKDKAPPLKTPIPTPKPSRLPTVKSTHSNKQPIPMIKDIDDEKSKTLKRDWWRLATEFVHIYIFFAFSMKYSRQAKIRNSLLTQRSKEIVNDISKIKEWIISIEQPFWDEFKVFEDLDVSFKNIDSTLKIQEKSQIIIAIIKKYMENLISSTSKMTKVPQEIQKVFFNYTRNKAYFPKQYLTTFQVNRLEFDVFGATQRITDPQAGMILAFLIICGVTVQQVLLHMKDVFPDFKHFPNITLTAKYIGSILHYLTRDTFQNEPEMIKELLVLLNYYRNYHLFNEQVEKQRDVFNNNELEFTDVDEFAEYLIPEDTITKFWELNKQFVITYKNFIYAWATKLAGLVRRKYRKTTDQNENIKQKIKRPKNRKVEYYLPEEEGE